MKRKKKSASRRRGEILPIDSYSLMGDPDSSSCVGAVGALRKKHPTYQVPMGQY